jgi:uncharacterized surface protein with fasciclin (FAS1) repeats
MRTKILISCLAVTTVVAMGCSSDPDDGAGAAETTVAGATTTTSTLAPGQYDIVATALGRSDLFAQLAGLVVDAGLVETLRGPGPFTVFAPTNAAFAKLPLETLHGVQDSADLLATVLTYHVVAGEFTLADLEEGPLPTVAGPDLNITRDGDKVFVNGNAVALGDVEATNGVIHVMGDVLVPEIGDIIDVATTLQGFSTLAELVTAADLIDTLKGEGPFTVFAPSDEAFAAVPAATLEAVGADPALLATVLTYHVVAGRLTTGDLKAGPLETVAGVDLTVTVDSDGTVSIDGHPIQVSNVPASNGIIHVMDAVLIPE